MAGAVADYGVMVPAGPFYLAAELGTMRSMVVAIAASPAAKYENQGGEGVICL